MKTSRYEVTIPLPDGHWVRIGPLYDSMTAAEIWALRRDYIDDYQVNPTFDEDD